MAAAFEPSSLKIAPPTSKPASSVADADDSVFPQCVFLTGALTDSSMIVVITGLSIGCWVALRARRGWLLRIPLCPFYFLYPLPISSVNTSWYTLLHRHFPNINHWIHTTQPPRRLKITSIDSATTATSFRLNVDITTPYSRLGDLTGKPFAGKFHL